MHTAEADALLKVRKCARFSQSDRVAPRPFQWKGSRSNNVVLDVRKGLAPSTAVTRKAQDVCEPARELDRFRLHAMAVVCFFSHLEAACMRATLLLSKPRVRV